MKTLKQFLFRHRFTLIGVGLGFIAGYTYYIQVGCEEGCTITGSPVNSTLYGGLMGGLVLSMLDDYLKKTKE
jgi:hypothetical protein